MAMARVRFQRYYASFLQAARLPQIRLLRMVKLSVFDFAGLQSMARALAKKKPQGGAGTRAGYAHDAAGL